MTYISFGEYERSRFRFELAYEKLNAAIQVIGRPDMGKSTLLGNLALQFHEAGEGVLVLDIKGDLTQDLAKRTKLPQDTVYVKMGPIDFGPEGVRYWTFNPFSGHNASDVRREQVRHAVKESFQLIGSADMQTMSNIRETLDDLTGVVVAMPDPTLIDMFMIVSRKDYRTQLLDRYQHINPISLMHWDELDNRIAERGSNAVSGRERRSYTNTTRNRLARLMNSEAILLSAGKYDSSIQLKEWLDAGKMVLVDLSSPLERDDGIDIGNLLLANIVIAIFEREHGKKDRRWRLVLDEFHEFANEQIALLITGGRSFNAFPVMANQDRSQFSKERHGSRLLGAIGASSVSVQLLPSREDRIDLARLYEHEDIAPFFDLTHFQAIVDTKLSPLDAGKPQKILLSPWRNQEVPGQYESLLYASLDSTTPKADLVDWIRDRYLENLDVGGKRDTRKSNASAKTKPTEPGESETAGVPAPEPDVPASPRSAGPARALDQLDDPGSALPGQPRSRRRRKPKGPGRGDGAGSEPHD